MFSKVAPEHYLPEARQVKAQLLPPPASPPLAFQPACWVLLQLAAALAPLGETGWLAPWETTLRVVRGKVRHHR